MSLANLSHQTCLLSHSLILMDNRYILALDPLILLKRLLLVCPAVWALDLRAGGGHIL